MAIVTINIDSQVPNLTRVTLQALIAGSDLSTQRAYVITDAVGGTKRIVVFATANNALSSLGLNQTDGSVGTYDISTDVYTASAGGSFVPYTGATSDVDLGLHKLLAQTLALNTTTAGTADVGVMAWNDTEGTIEFKLKGGNVTLQLGQEQVARVVNKTGGNLLEANYQCVYVSGAQGQRIKVNLAKADSQTTCENTLGLVTETINNNQEGFITTAGLVNAINTTGALQGETWADGDVLYLSQSTAGQITNVLPSSGIVVVVGYCVHAHATQGKIFVNVNVKLVQPYIPLAGTDVGSPVTGDIEVDDGVGFVYDDGTYVVELVSQFGRGWMLKMTETATSDTTYVDMRFDQIIFNSANPYFIGAVYGIDFSANFQLGSLIDLRTLKKRFWTKAGIPTTSDDNTQGYIVGSLLWDTTNSKMYRATSVTTGAAAWTEVFSGGVTDGDKGDVVVSSSGTVWTVEALQTRPVSNTAPTTGQLLVWNGSAWTPTTQTTHLYQLSNTNGDTVAAGTTYYALTNPITDSATQNARFTLMTHNGSVRRMKVLTISAQPSTLTTVFTLQKNGVDTAMTFTISPSAVAQTFSMSGAPITFVDGDTLGLKVVSTGTGTSATFGSMSTLIENTETL